VHVYVIDTGIRVTHSAFGGRASWGINTTGDGANSDGNGHGTHVAGTIVGSSYGVAKAAQVVAVKVLNSNGSGSITGVVDGVNWVTANAIKPAVANMSLGASGSSTTLEAAVRNSIASGVTYAVSSGNSNADAANFTPARVAEAITVNASDSTDARASFSNYGAGTDLFAPGVGIVSAWNTSDTATASLSGTSMASPHVAGAAALWLAAHPGDSPAAVQAGLITAATPAKVTGAPTGTPNRLLFTNAVTTPPPSPPVAATPGSQKWTVGTAVSLKLAASGATAPYTWTVASLPAGLTASTAGLVTGKPTTAGAGTAAITVKDAKGMTATTSFGWTVVPPLVSATPGSQKWTVGSPVSLKLTASGATAPYTWTVASLPAGLTASTAGLVTGTPTKAGTGTAAITVKDATGKVATSSFGWTVVLPPPINRPAVTNSTVVPIADLATVLSPITITGSGSAPANSRVEVHIAHTAIGNLVVELVAPDGTVYLLHNRTGGSSDNLDRAFQLNLSSELAAGTWKLRVRDALKLDVGRIVSWTLDL
jgi:hypothetical protein